MSDTIEQPAETGGRQVTVEDLQKMLDDVSGKSRTLEAERDAERSQRLRLQQDLDQERNNRTIAEGERDTAATRVISESERNYNLQKDAVKSGIDAQKSALASAKREQARHAEAGDWAAHGDATETVARAAAKLEHLETQQDFLEKNKERFVPTAPRPEARQQPAQQATRMAAPADAISQFVSDVLPSERTWLEQRPKFVNDANYRQDVFDASNFAAKKYVRGTDQYLREVERILGESPAVQQETHQQPIRQERQPSADLGVQRRAAPGAQQQGGRQQITLSPDEVEIADGMYGNPNGDDYIANPAERYKKYWDNKQLMQSRGRM